MAKIGFIGVGNMGGPMAVNLLKAGHEVTAFDLSAELMQKVVDAGGKKAATAADAVRDVEIVVSMLPAGKHVKAVYTGDKGILAERSEERRVGNECVSKCSSRWSPYH